MKEELIKEETTEVVPTVKTNKMPPLTKAQEAEIFKAIAHNGYKKVGYEFGFQHFYDNDKLIIQAVFAIVRKIRKAPELWNLSEDVVEVVETSIASRSVTTNPKLKSDVNILEESFRDRLDTMRDAVAEIIMKKIAKYQKKGGEDDISIRDLKDLLAMAIDKGRLLRGEGTENITKLAKIDVDNLSADDALKVIMKAREALVESKK